METFTVRHGKKKCRLCLVSLYPADRSGSGRRYYLGCGAYLPGGDGRLEWTGNSLRGEIPVPELVRWAHRRGYLEWTMKGE